MLVALNREKILRASYHQYYEMFSDLFLIVLLGIRLAQRLIASRSSKWSYQNCYEEILGEYAGNNLILMRTGYACCVILVFLFIMLAVPI